MAAVRATPPAILPRISNGSATGAEASGKLAGKEEAT